MQIESKNRVSKAYLKTNTRARPYNCTSTLKTLRITTEIATLSLENSLPLGWRTLRFLLLLLLLITTFSPLLCTCFFFFPPASNSVFIHSSKSEKSYFGFTTHHTSLVVTVSSFSSHLFISSNSVTTFPKRALHVE